MRRFAVCLLLLLAAVLPARVEAQQRRADDPARRAAMQARRDSLEAVVVQKFLERLTGDLKLNEEQRSRTEQVLKASGDRRSELMQASAGLRRRLYRAARSSSTTEAEFARLLAEHEELRAREHDLWRHDQEQLAGVLSLRQRAQFIISWTQFQESLREILSQRPRSDGDRRKH